MTMKLESMELILREILMEIELYYWQTNRENEIKHLL